MADWFSEYIGQIGDIWENLNRRAQITVLIGMVGVFLGLVFLIIFAGEGDYEVLFSQLNPEDADAIVNNLEEQGVPYKLENNGATIKVPAEHLHKTRLDMAGEGLPGKGLVGFEIFDESQFGTTDFERKVNFNRALGGELSRSIQSIESVKQARVQVTASEESLFKENQEPAKASVLLELNPGVTLDNSQIKAISNLVSSGVKDLDSENVTIVDSNGNLLTVDGDSPGSYQDSEINYASNLDYQQEFEKGLQTDLEKLLTRVLGPGNFAVQVRARINFDREEMESKEYSPVVDDEGILRSQEESSERQEGGTSGNGGSPGTDSNLPQYQAEEDEGENFSYQRSDTVSNFEINERITRHSYAPGQVERLSVSVMVDNDLSAEQRDVIENSVQAAIGYDSERNDVVNVAEMDFDDTLEEEVSRMRAEAEAKEARRMYLYTGIIIFILLLLLFAVIKLRPARAPQPGEELDITLEEELQEAETEETEMATTELTEEQKKRKQMKEELEELVYDNPEGVADILKSWLTED